MSGVRVLDNSLVVGDEGTSTSIFKREAGVVSSWERTPFSRGGMSGGVGDMLLLPVARGPLCLRPGSLRVGSEVGDMLQGLSEVERRSTWVRRGSHRRGKVSSQGVFTTHLSDLRIESMRKKPPGRRQINSGCFSPLQCVSSRASSCCER